MSKQVQFRRGTTAEHSTFTGAVGEITVDTTKDTVVVHDGSTVGGFPLLRESAYTATDVLTKLKTVDGSGSGLDADLLDGQDRTYYATAESVTAAASMQTITDTIMSKAAFNALAAERRANRAGSGFDEWGRHPSITISYPNINEGMWTNPNAVNAFRVGIETSGSNTGISKTTFANSSINGSLIALKYINDTADRASIILPPAPTVYPYDATLTAEQIASGVIKHADASNSGLIVNGKFDADTSGWSNVSTGTGTFTYSSGKVSIVGTNSSNRGSFSQTMSLVIGKTYTLECEVASLSGSVSIGGTAVGVGGATAISGRNVFSFVATQGAIYFYTQSGGGSCTIDNIAVYPADAISRSDLVFLESWHEDVSEKDFVYPLGNVQYLGTTGDSGTPVAGAFAGSATYSLFSDTWQADGALVGKGYVWSTLSDDNKKAFVSNPENNMYLDGDKYIQVRYRMRVVAGMGDTWANVDPQVPYATPVFTTITHLNSNLAVVSKGKNISIAGDFLGSPRFLGSKFNNTETGVFVSESATDSYAGTKTFALPIALVHR